MNADSNQIGKLTSDRISIASLSSVAGLATFFVPLILTLACQPGRKKESPDAPPSLAPDVPTHAPEPSPTASLDPWVLTWDIDEIARVLTVSTKQRELPAARYSLAPAKAKCSSSQRIWHSLETSRTPLPQLLGGDYRICFASDSKVDFIPDRTGVFSLLAQPALLFSTKLGERSYAGAEIFAVDLPHIELAHRVSLSDGVAYFLASDGQWARSRWTGAEWIGNSMKEGPQTIRFEPLPRLGFLRSYRAANGSIETRLHNDQMLAEFRDVSLVAAAKQLVRLPMAVGSDGADLQFFRSGDANQIVRQLPASCPQLSDLKIVSDDHTATTLVVCRSPSTKDCILLVMRHELSKGVLLSSHVLDSHSEHCDPFLQRELLDDRGTPVAYYHRRGDRGFTLYATRISEDGTSSSPVALYEQQDVASFGIILVHGSHELAWGGSSSLMRMYWAKGKAQFIDEVSGLDRPHILAASNKIIKEEL